MDTNYPHRLTQRETIELQTKIQKLQWLLKECIGLEEYELCTQIRNIIHRLHQQIENAQQP